MKAKLVKALPLPLPSDTYSIEDLTKQEVQDLVDVAACIGGSYESARGTFGRIIKAFEKFGFRFNYPLTKTWEVLLFQNATNTLQK